MPGSTKVLVYLKGRCNIPMVSRKLDQKQSLPTEKKDMSNFNKLGNSNFRPIRE